MYSSSSSESQSSDEEFMDPRRHRSVVGADVALNLDQIIHKCENKRRFGCCQTVFQNISFIIVSMGILCANPIILGISFLLIQPTKFKCHINGSW